MGTAAPAPGLWVHSFEEDRGDQEVYRPESHVLPPTRGRRRMLQVLDDGSIREMGPGPDDRPHPTGTVLKPAGMNRYTAQVPGEPGPESSGLVVLTASDTILRVARS
ncbi:hypothetical protein OK351_04375 [Glutamicibacter sp. MNS18]|uniref:hypothetical protein n=1 Tax=Glutamicibacter sp. MNS18 TaxID=2989817 RepID=UPI0022355740|nr:hypothetical protein [Glutamicibacter sp. MNS18]MCW4464741.1 hypothetical protein [Glutamicibacter sp. MNS18]